MSFKDVRDLAEHLKLLGFPSVFPLQALATNFGSLASFRLVAEILQWLAGLLEPGAVLPGGVTNEDERVSLIRSATEFFVTKSAIKLNPRKLYAASAISAAELQKITRLLITPATQGSASDKDAEDEAAADNYRSLNQVDIGDKMDELRRARELSSDLTQRGAALHDLLSKEMLNKEARLLQANRVMELASVERTLKNAIAAAQLKLQSGRAQLENSRVESNALASKLQRKRAELERTKQRLSALQKIRPAHMQEFETCEQELQQLFQQYFLRLHVRDALRAQFEARTKRGAAAASPSASPMLQKPGGGGESSMPFIPEISDDEDEDDGARLDGGGGLRRGLFGLDAEIPDIRDEDLMLRGSMPRGQQQEPAGGSNGKRPGTATSRSQRPTTGRGRKVTVAAGGGGGGGAQGGRGRIVPTGNSNIGAQNPEDEDDSSFGTSESDLDMGGIMRLGAGGIPSFGLSNMDAGSELGIGDDDFDLNSIDDISISKITGELPLRPKTASKPEHHSDEDF